LVAVRPDKDMEEFVPLRFVRSMTEAEQIRTILEDHDVEVEIKDDDVEPAHDGVGAAFAVMVAIDFLEEARHILEQRSSIDDELELSYAQITDADDSNNEDETVDNTDHEAALEELYELEEEEEDEDDEEEKEDL